MLWAAISSLSQAHGTGRSPPGQVTLALVCVAGRPRSAQTHAGADVATAPKRRPKWSPWKVDKMEGCRVMEGRRCLRWHPSILAYTFKGHAYSMTLLPLRSPSCPAPPSQLSRSSAPSSLPCRGGSPRGEAWGISCSQGYPDAGNPLWPQAGQELTPPHGGSR